MIFSATVTLLLLKCISAEFLTGDSGGWQQYMSHGINTFGNNHLALGSQVQDLSAFGSLGHVNIGHGWNQVHQEDHHAHAIPIGEHIEVTKPIAIPVYKNIGIPLVQPIGIPVAHVTAVGVPQPYPIHVPVAHPVPIPIIKTVATIIEKKVPFPIEKIIPVPVEKPVPITIEKQVPVEVEKPYPIHVPIYKHVFHRHKSHGWDR